MPRVRVDDVFCENRRLKALHREREEAEAARRDFAPGQFPGKSAKAKAKARKNANRMSLREKQFAKQLGLAGPFVPRRKRLEAAKRALEDKEKIEAEARRQKRIEKQRRRNARKADEARRAAGGAEEEAVEEVEEDVEEEATADPLHAMRLHGGLERPEDLRESAPLRTAAQQRELLSFRTVRREDESLEAFEVRVKQEMHTKLYMMSGTADGSETASSLRKHMGERRKRYLRTRNERKKALKERQRERRREGHGAEVAEAARSRPRFGEVVERPPEFSATPKSKTLPNVAALQRERLELRDTKQRLDESPGEAAVRRQRQHAEIRQLQLSRDRARLAYKNAKRQRAAAAGGGAFRHNL